RWLAFLLATVLNGQGARCSMDDDRPDPLAGEARSSFRAPRLPSLASSRSALIGWNPGTWPMIGFKTAWPVIRLLPPELAQRLALLALRMPAPSIYRLAHDPFDWEGLRFRNRVGIAAGFDKNAIALRGIELLGAGFVEVGTILVKPWRGSDVRPRVKRITS